jgi:hypothetical protein
MASDKIIIEPLNEKNAAVWFMRIKLLLIHKDLWDIEKNTPANNEKAYALLGLNVGDQYLTILSKCNSSIEF